MPALKVIQIGDSTAVILPPEILRGLRAEAGDILMATESARGYFLEKFDPEISEELEAGRELMKRYRDTFKALAE